MTGGDVVMDMIKQYDDGLITGMEMLGELYKHLKVHPSKREEAARGLRGHSEEYIRGIMADELNRLLD